ncbi:hypothetical protein [Streptococcus uberis]|uniref:hypothetical protein n=1 Tax=Streptococcus uberis TaxID=1349 RepID=UPI0027DDECBA|nr:hypothetical protein [Streptococcus uberis]MCK1238475.1 hypothetical protein [Streptococcus uberis]
MGLKEVLLGISEAISVATDTKNKSGQIKELQSKLKAAYLLNEQKDDYVKELGGKLLRKGVSEGGEILADFKKFKNKK